MCHTTKRTSVSYTQHQKCALLSEECEHVSKCFQLKAAATKSSIASSSQWGMWAHVSKCFWTLLLLAARGKRSAPYHRHTWNHHKKYFQGQECKITWEGVTLGVSTPVTGNPRCCSIRWLRSLILVIIIGHMIIIVTTNEILFVIIVTINEILVIIIGSNQLSSNSYRYHHP